MGQTRKKNYDRYTLAYKLQAVKLANHPDVRSKDVAESLGIHPVMLYRWQMEHRRGELRENKHMKSSSPSPKRRASRADPAKEAEEKLAAAEKRIKKLERELENRNDEIDLLKKAERFFQRKK
ncbi:MULTISPECIES: transposase [unclassified Pseudoalteromonas]|uniref:transposase n=1 Tax=unclassified Pseudoalteromonas TaxID=194690 RepID=UPI002359DE2A|nr:MULTISPECIES: transposase [unclassified Pseudoalteromonas]MDC9575646.1 transposase [Pseudoalteromonas sp. GABNS16A]MDC9611540.1 transposase [Pseudoalteromonas sp. GABNS16H]